MSFFGLPSLVGLLIQTIGVMLVAALSLGLCNTLKRDPLRYWSYGWCVLFGALAALFVGFNLPSVQALTQPIYILGEYTFAYLVGAGCRLYISGKRLQRRETWMLLPGGLIAFGLPPLLAYNFNLFFIVHTLVYACLFLAAFRTLWRVWPDRGAVIGVRVMKIALGLLTLDYVHYAPIYAASAAGVLPDRVPYLEYSPLYDLIFLMLLAFGMVMVTTGEVQHELEVVNARLAQTRDRLEAMVQLDHLTSALNRHGFYSILGDSSRDGRVIFRGCAAMADIDNLKTINDRYGHGAGDAAIRSVARAIRTCIRADDLLFRWGGDEFLVLLIGMTEQDARARLDSVNASLRNVTISGVAEPVTVSVSLGYAPFHSAESLEEVIAIADSAMYGRKKEGQT